MPPSPPHNANLHGCYPTDNTLLVFPILYSMASHIFDCLCLTENLKRLLAMSCREVPQVQHMVDVNMTYCYTTFIIYKISPQYKEKIYKTKMIKIKVLGKSIITILFNLITRKRLPFCMSRKLTPILFGILLDEVKGGLQVGCGVIRLLRIPTWNSKAAEWVNPLGHLCSEKLGTIHIGRELPSKLYIFQP